MTIDRPIEENPVTDVFLAPKASPMYVNALKEKGHTLHTEVTADNAHRIRAIAGGGESRVPADVIDRLPNLEIVAIMGVGYDGVDVAAAKARGAVVSHTPDVLNDDVADLAIALMLNAARQLPAADRYVRSGDWEARGPMPLQRKMSGARLGIVGMGRIGQAIAHRAAAFGMKIAYTARSAKPQLPHAFHANVVDLARESDFLVVITPGGAGTRHMINAQVLQALGKKGILVNVARGSVVDEDALIDALEKGVIGGAGLDVFADEPRVPQRLRDVPHVVLAPHVGSATNETRRAMVDLAVSNLEAKIAGRPCPSLVPECR
jgi:lactate dehydrogenase-like 2-hydroxyacid dehydrogenase